MEWMNLIQTLAGIAGGFGFGALTKSGRVKAKADAYKAMADAYEARLTALHENIALLNKAEMEQSKRISDLNHALNDKTQRIRELTDKLYSSEQEVNRVQDLLNAANEKITRLTEERDDWKAKAEYYRQWHCRSNICMQGHPDPMGRQPPNSKLQGQKFKEPK